MILNFVLLFVASAIIFSLLIPKPQIEDAKAQEFSEDGFPQATENAPIPYLVGGTRLNSPNTLFAGGFRNEEITERVRTGLFSKKTVVIGYRYYLTLDLGFCLGDTLAGCRLTELYVDDQLVWSGDIASGTFNVSRRDLFGGDENGGGFEATCRFYPGTFSQAKDPYIDALPDSGGLLTPYRGVAHIVFEDAYIGEQPQLRAINATMTRYTNRLGIAGGNHIVAGGSNWAEALYDILVNTWGGLGADPDLLDGPEFIAVADIVATEGNGCAGVIQNATDGENVIKELLKQADALLTIDPLTNLAQPLLLRKDYDEGTLPVFGPGVITSVPKFTQTLWAELVSEVKGGFKDPANNYQDTTAVAQDLAVANITGRLKTTTIQLPFVKNKSLANDIVGRELNQLSQIATQATLKINRNAYQLRPGTVFKWTWPDYGISEMIVRVKEGKDGNDHEPEMEIDVVRDTYDNTNNPFAQAPTTGAQPLGVAPAEVTIAEFFDAPEFLVIELAGNLTADTSTDASYIYALPQPGNAVSVSVDGLLDDADSMFSNAPFPLYGINQTPLTVLDGFTDGNAGSITLLNVDTARVGELANGGSSAIRNGQQLFYMNGEIFGYQTFTNNGGGSITLNNCRRALLNTRQQVHALNDVAYFLDGSTVSESVTSAAASPADVKFIPSSGAIKLDPATIGNTSVTVVGAISRPDPPDYTQIFDTRSVADQSNGATITVSWRARDKSKGSVQLIDDSADTEPAGTTYTLHLYNLSAGGGAVYTQSSISGSTHMFVIPGGQNGGDVMEVRVWADNGGEQSINYDFIQFSIIPPNQLILSGDEQSGTDKLQTSGDEQSGTDVINLSGDES